VVWVPERHDLLLMKAVRAARHDEEVIVETDAAMTAPCSVKT
jgi:hypothetical protein